MGTTAGARSADRPLDVICVRRLRPV